MIDEILNQGWLDHKHNDLNDIKQRTQDVICRIFFLRHGDTWTTSDLSNIQYHDAKLNEKWQQEMIDACDRLVNMWCKPEDTLIIYSPWSEEKVERIVESQERFLENWFTDFCIDDRLDTSKRVIGLDGKNTLNQPRSVVKLRKSLEIAELIQIDLIDALKSYTWYAKYKNIVLLWHRANSAFTEIAKQIGEPLEIGKRKIETGEILQHDINKSYEIIPYHNRKNILCLTNDNISKILSILIKENWLDKYIQAFNSKKINIYELQNIINGYCSEHLELYEKYLASENEDLRVFCLVNLIKLKKYSYIEENMWCIVNSDNILYLQHVIGAIIDWEEKNIVNDMIECIDICLRNLYLGGKVNTNLQVYIDEKIKNKEELKERCEYYTKLIEYHKNNILPELSNIRNKSLDGRYHTIDYNQKEKDPKDIKIIDNNFSISDPKIENNCLSILENNQIVVLEGDGWAGKSFFSLYLQEQLKNNKFRYWGRSYCPIYIQLNGKDIDEVRRKIEYWKNTFEKYGDTLVYFFESLDESKICDEKNVKWLLDYIRENDMKAIISTRVWYINIKENTSSVNNYFLNGMKNPMIYVKEYFKSDTEKIERYIKLQEKVGEKYLWENSLFVVMLCELVDWWQDVNEISGSRELFGALVEKRLCNRENKKLWRELNNNIKSNIGGLEKKELMKRIGMLKKIAYKKYIGEKIDMDKIFGNMDPEALSFLFRIDEKGNYDFIHKDFEEYFFLRYISSDVELLKSLLEKPILSFRSREIFYMTAKQWYNELFSKILDLWVDIDYVAINVSFMEVCMRWNLHAAKLLFEKYKSKIRMNQNDSLEYACHKWNIELAQWLIDNFNVNTWNILKTVDNESHIMRYMKKNGLERKFNKMQTIFKLHCSEGNIKVVKWLLDEYKIELDDDIKKESIGTVCMHWHIDIAKLLFERWNDKIKETDFFWRTYFMQACENWHLDLAELLLDQGIDIDAGDRSGFNAFMRACTKWNMAVAQWLLDRWCNIDAVDRIWHTAFFSACVHRKFEMVQRLLDRWAVMNMPDNFWRTIFRHMCGNGDFATMDRLLEHGYDINECDKNDFTVFMDMCLNGNVQVAQWLLDKWAEINTKEKWWHTIFMLACALWKLSIVKWLFEKWCDVDVKNNLWVNAFVLSCQYWKKNVVKRFLGIWEMSSEDLVEWVSIAVENWYENIAKMLRKYVKR